jgi:periplasmic protein TonB
MDAVGHVLAQRQQEPFPWAAGVALAFLLHASVLAAILLASMAHPIRYLPTRAVAVRLVQAGSVKGGSSAVTAPEPQPEKPKIEKPPEEAPPPPTEKAKLLPAKKEEKKKPAAPAATAPTSRKAADSRPASAPSATRGEGGPVGAGGNVGIGGATFDQPDFNYSYYIERMLVMIGTNWFKPAQSVPTSPVIRFQILRDGTISGADVERTSGLAFVDRAALRAVLASSPLPPLPAEFGGDHLGVHLIFE